MTILVIGNSGTIQEVDATFRAAHCSIRQWEALNYNKLSISCASLGGFGSPDSIVSFKNVSKYPIAVRRVSMSVMTTTAYLAGFAMQFNMYRVRNWTGSVTGGTVIAPVRNNKMRESMPNVTNGPEIRAATAGTAVTATASSTTNTQPIGGINFFVFGLGTGTEKVDFVKYSAADYPLVFQNQQGFRIRTDVNFAATGVMRALFTIEYAEMGGV
jgi:hypothetical protein